MAVIAKYSLLMDEICYADKLKCSFKKMVCARGVNSFTVHITELDREKQDFPPYLICHGQKIGSSRILLATRSEVADCVCKPLQV